MKAILLLGLVGLVIVGCAGQPSHDMGHPGFVMGFIHGLLLPIEMICEFFIRGVKIYAYPNDGVWYDFGYFLGVGGFSAGFWHTGSRL